MFKSAKSSLLSLIILTIAYLISLFFVLQMAKDEGIFWLVAVILLIIFASLGGKASKILFNEGFLMKFIAGILISIFAIGTLVIVFLVFVGV